MVMCLALKEHSGALVQCSSRTFRNHEVDAGDGENPFAKENCFFEMFGYTFKTEVLHALQGMTKHGGFGGPVLCGTVWR